MSAPLLEIEGLSRRYALPRPRLFAPAPQFAAVSDISFSIAEGECLAIVGESGCGKSTLARLIAGLDRPSAGHLRWAPMPEGCVPVQMVFQDPFSSLNPRRTIGWSLQEPLYRSTSPRNQRIARMRAMLEDVGLSPEVATRYPHEFSGGQRQRIALARALMPNPRLLIADEPTSALDLSVQAQILALLGELRTRHKLAILFISHNLLAVRAVADRVLVMADGQRVELGTTTEIFTRPTHPITQNLLDAELILPNLTKFSLNEFTVR
jgi:peptide/nickel transport system ATP-binding protein